MQSIFTILMQWPLRENLSRISTRSSHKHLHKITQGPLREDFTTISTGSLHKDVPKLLENFGRILKRSSHKDLYKMQGSHEGFQQDLHKSFSYGPVQEMTLPGSPQDLLEDFIWIFTTFSHKDLYKTIQDHTTHTRPWSRSSMKDVHELFARSL